MLLIVIDCYLLLSIIIFYCYLLLGDGGYSLADSPRGLASTLDALIDASKPTVETTPQSSQQTTHIHPVSHATQRSDPAVISNTPAETINPGVPVSTGSFLPISSSTPVMIPAQPAMSTVINQQDLVMQQQQLALQQQVYFYLFYFSIYLKFRHFIL